MNDIAFLMGDIVIYWDRMIIILGFAAGLIFSFALCSVTRVRKSAVVLWAILALIFSIFFSRMIYYYCLSEQFTTLEEAFMDLFASKYSIVGVVAGTLLAALAVKLACFERNAGKLLDTVFPGTVIALSMIRLSYYFTDTFHSKLTINRVIWQRLPFAVQTEDAAGNISWTFAPFMISFLVLLASALVITLLARRKIRHTGDMFLLTFVFLALSDMVLEGTRNDSLKLHFMFLDSLNKYVSFISISMLVFAICILIIFFVNYKRSISPDYRKSDNSKNLFTLIIFLFGFICFCVCEYLVQRYTSQENLFHWLQAGSALLMAVSTVSVINLKNVRLKTPR